MKTSFLSFIVMTMLCMMSCSKEEQEVVKTDYVATYRFKVEDTITNTRAAVNPNMKITWNEGDEICFTIRLYDPLDKRTWLDGINVFEQEKVCKMVYSGEAWKTYVMMDEFYQMPDEVFGPSPSYTRDDNAYKEVDDVELHSKILNGYVIFRYDLYPAKENIIGGYQKFDFKEGPQTISIQVLGNL